MGFKIGDRVKVFDETENDWFEGEIIELYDDGVLVEYETEYYWHVKTVEFKYIEAI